MFGIDWLRAGVPVDKDASVLTSEAEVVADARMRARDVVKRHPGREPDSFRLTGPTGEIFGVSKSTGDSNFAARELGWVGTRSAAASFFGLARLLDAWFAGLELGKQPVGFICREHAANLARRHQRRLAGAEFSALGGRRAGANASYGLEHAWRSSGVFCRCRRSRTSAFRDRACPVNCRHYG
jgi:hypothetical protein